MIHLHKFKNKMYEGKEQSKESNNLMYLYMICISINTGKMFGGNSHLSNNILTFTADFVKEIYYRIYDLIPCMEQGVNHYTRGSKIWMELNSFKAKRIDFAFDLKTMQQQYLTLIDRGYGLRNKNYERTYYKSSELDEIIDDDEPDFPNVDYNANVNYVYFKGKGININIYHKGTEVEKENLPHDENADYDFLRIEVQVKKNKLNAIVAKFGLPSRELRYLATPEVEAYVLESNVTALTGTGVYVTYNHALKIIDESDLFKNKKKQRLQAVIKAVTDKHSVAKVLEEVKNGTITDLGKFQTVQTYLREIHNLGINPVTLSFRMNVPRTKLTNLTGGDDLQEQVLPSLVDEIKVYCEQVKYEQEHGTPITEELIKQIKEM